MLKSSWHKATKTTYCAPLCAKSAWNDGMEEVLS
jgi:hypothetical protein